MKHQEKKTTRITFDCSPELHLASKMKALSRQKSLKDYFTELLIKDVFQSGLEIDEEKEFNNWIPDFIEKHKELFKGLASR